VNLIKAKPHDSEHRRKTLYNKIKVFRIKDYKAKRNYQQDEEAYFCTRVDDDEDDYLFLKNYFGDIKNYGSHGVGFLNIPVHSS